MQAQSITFQDLLNTKLSFSTNLTTGDIIISLLLTFLVSLFIYFIYQKTYTGVLYSRDFNLTLIVVSVVVAVIMLGISRNLALSLGMVGALSIVRFRSAIKDPKDIAFLFWAISVGIINGIQFYKLSIISCILIGIIIIIFSKRFSFKEPYVLVVKSKPGASVSEVLKKYCSKYKVRSTTFVQDLEDQTFEVKVKKGQEQQLLNEIRSISGVREVMMFSYTGKLNE